MTAQERPSGVMFSMCLAVVLVVASVSALNLALPSIAVDLKRKRHRPDMLLPRLRRRLDE
jgi:hypothetical protein